MLAPRLCLERKIAPLVNYYAKKGLHTAIDASLESSVVFSNVISALENLKKRVRFIY